MLAISFFFALVFLLAHPGVLSGLHVHYFVHVLQFNKIFFFFFKHKCLTNIRSLSFSQSLLCDQKWWKIDLGYICLTECNHRRLLLGNQIDKGGK